MVVRRRRQSLPRCGQLFEPVPLADERPGDPFAECRFAGGAETGEQIVENGISATSLPRRSSPSVTPLWTSAMATISRSAGSGSAEAGEQIVEDCNRCLVVGKMIAEGGSFVEECPGDLFAEGWLSGGAEAGEGTSS